MVSLENSNPKGFISPPILKIMKHNNRYIQSLMMITKMLDNLINIIEKSENYLNKRKIDSNLVVHSRLIIDMYPFSSQIHIATDMTRKGFARLAQIKSPSYKNNEKTLAQHTSRPYRFRCNFIFNLFLFWMHIFDCRKKKFLWFY